MGDITGFLTIPRVEHGKIPASDRIRNSNPFDIALSENTVREQAARCMDCGIPYCHDNPANAEDAAKDQHSGCPVQNQIPDWNNLVYGGHWRTALTNLHSTNNFPDFTGKICPAPCEASCVLNLTDEPVTIKSIEDAIITKGFNEGWVTPEYAHHKTGKKVAVVGSGPAGLACAQQLARAGHEVHVYEKNARPGGLLRYGIPDFKLHKSDIDRRIAQITAEGVIFHCNTIIGKDISAEKLVHDYDAVALAAGCEVPRDLTIPGRDLKDVHFAMDFLTQHNRRVSGELGAIDNPILADGKKVIVIGDGDTGADCIGTSNRLGAVSVTQFALKIQPPAQDDKLMEWPQWPHILRLSSSHEEGDTRLQFAVAATEILGDADGNVKGIKCLRLDEKRKPITGSAFTIAADLVLLAIGFTNPVKEGMLDQFGLAYDKRGNVAAQAQRHMRINGRQIDDPRNYLTSHTTTDGIRKVYAGGDIRRGASLVVWAIREGREMAASIDQNLMKQTCG